MHSLILLPGLACDDELVRHQAAALRLAGQRVVVADVHARFDDLPSMARALLAKQPGRLVLVGCSMGGMVAMEVARQAPDRVHGIALLGTTARPDTPELIALRTKACELFAAGRMDEVLAANAMLAFHPDRAADRALVAGYLAMIRRAGADQLIRQNHAVMARIDSRPSLARWRWPTLVAVGESDSLTPPEHAREMIAAIPDAELALVPGAGHLLTLEQPERVSALLIDWLGRLTT